MVWDRERTFLSPWTEADEAYEVETKRSARGRMRLPADARHPLDWGEPLSLLEEADTSPRIEAVEVDLVTFDEGRMEGEKGVFVHLTTDTGVTGHGHFIHPDPTFTPAVIEESLGAGVLGRDPMRVGHVTEALIRSKSRFRRKHHVMYAIGAIDEALWDLRGKLCGQPVWKLLGGYRDAVPTYVSIFAETPAGVRDVWEHAADMGFDALKLHTTSLELVREAREIVGPGTKLMLDCAPGPYFDRTDAIEMGRAFEAHDIYWYEDMVPMEDTETYAAVAAALDTPVVTGARDASPETFRWYGERGVADIWNPDVIVVGGITQWMKLASLAGAYGIPITPHLNPLASMHMAAAAPNATFIELMTWELPGYAESTLGDLLTSNPLEDPEDGWITLPDEPGLGYEFDRDAIAAIAG